MPDSPSRTLYLIDASPYIFRAHFSLPSSMCDPQGARTGAVYGFTSFLLKLIATERPSHLAVAFDRNLNGSFRNALYPAYKKQREDPPPEIVLQIPLCLEMAETLGAASFIDEDFEADDIIATLCDQLRDEEIRFVVVSPDKDLAQLVGERVGLLDFAKNVRLGVAEVRERLGVAPSQVTDFLGLAGDSVDNIPGVPGIGPKTAADLLSVFPNLEEIYAHLDQLLKPGFRGGKNLHAKLTTHREQAFLSRTLATLARNAPVRGILDRLEYRGTDKKAADDLFARLGFGTLAARATAET
jgi:DNA polymerase-1